LRKCHTDRGCESVKVWSWTDRGPCPRRALLAAGKQRPRATKADVGRRTSVIGRLLHKRDVRRVALSFGGFTASEYGVWIAVLVYAYEHGGTTKAGLVAVAQLLPAAFAAPLLAGFVDRHGAARALLRGYWAQSATLAATGGLMLGSAPEPLVYATAVLAAIAITMTRPAQAGMLPALVESADELTGINALSGWVESVSDLLGTAIAGLLIALDGAGAAVGFFAVCVTVSALLVTPVALAYEPAAPPPGVDEAPADACGGLIALRDDRALAALVAVLGAEYLVVGVLDVLLVVLAISVLELGAPGAGYLSAAFGAGGIAGSLAAVWLIGRRRLASPLIGASIGWALLLAVLGAWPTVAGAFLLLAAAGAARTVLDVSGRTMLLRRAPAEVRGRVFGLLEGVAMLGLALGSVLVPVLVTVGGAGLALVATGVMLCAITLAVAARVHDVERPPRSAAAPAAAGLVILPW
jgi:MFS family permease